MRQAWIIPCIFFKKIKKTSKPPIPIELGLKFVKSKYFEQSKKNAIFLEKEISSVIAAWHYFVHISCNFRLDNSGENANFKREGFERGMNFKTNIFNYTCW